MTAAVRLDYVPVNEGERAGLAARLNNRGYVFWGLSLRQGKRVLELLVQDGDRKMAYAVETDGRSPVHLRLGCDGEAYSFSYSADGEAWLGLEQTVHISVLSPETNGGFTGVCLGLHASGNGSGDGAPAYFEGFRYGPLGN